MRRPLLTTLTLLGPGFAVAATGVGAGDVVTAAVAGAQFGAAVLWAAAVGALLKFTLNEGIARWQLATGTTLLAGWARHLHRAVLYGFMVYLVLWTVVVAGALMAACGLGAHALFPGLSVATWGVVHALTATVLVLAGRYALFERLMKGFIALMFTTVVTAALLVHPDWGAVVRGMVVPTVPAGSAPLLLGVIGGVGGTVTLLSYSYWMRERGWEGPAFHYHARMDLVAAYTLTGLFGMAVLITAAGAGAEAVTGNRMALALAERIGAVVGAGGKWIFLVGFWGAVFSSMLGVWQGVPYLFADFVYILRHPGIPAAPPAAAGSSSRPYRLYLLFLTLAPMPLLLFDRPVWIVLVYSVAGAFFMPFLAGTLLYLNNRHIPVQALRNGRWINGLLTLALLLFAALCLVELARQH